MLRDLVGSWAYCIKSTYLMSSHDITQGKAWVHFILKYYHKKNKYFAAALRTHIETLWRAMVLVTDPKERT